MLLVKRSQAGFTIIELILAILMGGMLVFAASEIYFSVFKASEFAQNRIESAIDEAQAERVLLKDFSRAGASFNNLVIKDNPSDLVNFLDYVPSWNCMSGTASCERSFTIDNPQKSFSFLIDDLSFGGASVMSIERVYDVGAQTDLMLSPDLTFNQTKLNSVLTSLFSAKPILQEGQLILVHGVQAVAPTDAEVPRFPMYLLKVNADLTVSSYNPNSIMDFRNPLTGMTPGNLDEFFRNLPNIPGSGSIYVRPVKLIKLSLVAMAKPAGKYQLLRTENAGASQISFVIRSSISKAVLKRPTLTLPSMEIEFVP